MTWPPIDVHAHIDPAIGRTDLLELRAVVFAATRSLSEFMTTLSRNDPVAVWGVGTHPGRTDALNEFTAARFAAAIRTTPLVSEVGLDRRSGVPIVAQLRVLNQIFEILENDQRIVSVHSAGATIEVLNVIRRHRLQGVVLHWWRGSASETAYAVELGCWFSVNHAELHSPTVLGRVPAERLLTETDHPYGNRSTPAGRPGGVSDVEVAIMQHYPDQEARALVWANFSKLVTVTQTLNLFPDRIKGMLRLAGDDEHDE